MRSEDDFQAEIEAHLALEAERLVAEGMSPEEARSAAQRAFGNRTRVREAFRESRRWRWWEPFVQDLRYAFRCWRKRPGLALVVVLSLGVGIGAITAIFSVVNTLLLKELPYREAQRLMYVTEYWPHEPMVPGPPSPDFAHWQAQSQLVEAMAGYGGGAALTLSGAGEPERVQGTSVTHQLLPLLGTQLAQGRVFRAEEDRPGAAPVAILGYSLWQRRFGGSPGVIGQTITLNGTVRTVVGVLPAEFRFPDNNFREELLVPMTLPVEPQWRENFRFLRVIVRAKPGVSPEAVRQEFAGLVRANAAQEPARMAVMRRDLEVRVTPLREWLTGKVKAMLLALQLAAAMVLLIASFNVASLQVAVGIARRKELALRASIGAAPGRLIRQLLTESLWLSLLGGAVGIAVAYGSLSGLRAYLPATLHLADGIRIDGQVLGFALLLTVAVGVLTGLAPALASARISGEQALREGQHQTTGGRASQRLLSALVIAEVAVAMVLLVGAGLLTRTLIRLASESPGFDAAGVLTLKVAPSPRKYPESAERNALFQALLERARAIPGVEVAAIGGGLPLVGSAGAAGVSFQDRPEPPVGGRPSIPVAFVSPDYFRALGIPVIRGRAFSETDRVDAPLVAIVNQAFAEAYFPGENALGKRIEFGSREGHWREIVGVVGSVRQLGNLPVDPFTVYGALPHSFESEAFLVLKSARQSGQPSPAQLARAAVRAVHAVDPHEPVFDIATMEERLSLSLSGPRATVTLMSLFGVIALLLANVGVLGVVTYFVSRRKQEIGIRMALGATSFDVTRTVFFRGLALVAAGVFLGSIAASGLTRWLGARLPGLGPGDPLTLAAVAAVFLFVAAIACWLPARWAAGGDPALALRQG